MIRPIIFLRSPRFQSAWSRMDRPKTIPKMGFISGLTSILATMITVEFSNRAKAASSEAKPMRRTKSKESADEARRLATTWWTINRARTLFLNSDSLMRLRLLSDRVWSWAGEPFSRSPSLPSVWTIFADTSEPSSNGWSNAVGLFLAALCSFCRITIVGRTKTPRGKHRIRDLLHLRIQTRFLETFLDLLVFVQTLKLFRISMAFLGLGEIIWK